MKTIEEKRIEGRIEVLMAMQTIMGHLNDEYDYENWLMVGEIEDEERAREIAEDKEMFQDYINDFKSIFSECVNKPSDLY